MSSERTDRGYYTADALRHNGMREQWARMRGADRIVVEIVHEGTWVVYDRINYAGDRGFRSTATSFHTLDEARREYRRLIRKHQ